MRIGIGYDVHKLVENRALILGGVSIPYEKGLLGHSDSDVLIHAVIDALLGAAGLGDIGRHFPDTDDAYKGISSIEMLKKVCMMLKYERYTVVNIDCIIIAQKPKLAGYIPEMERLMATCIHSCFNCGILCDEGSSANCLSDAPNKIINIKATTEEGLGFTGAGEGIAAKAVCLIRQSREAVLDGSF